MKTNNISFIKTLRYGLLIIAISFLSPYSFSQSKKENSKPNVVMIIFDDLRDHESFTPFKVQTPNFDRLAERGMKFDRAYCQLPVCNSSRASFLSGLRPPTTRVVQNKEVDYKLSKDVVTLPQALKNNGYYTISIGKVFHNNTDDGRSWDKDMEHDPGYRDPIQYHNHKEKYAVIVIEMEGRRANPSNPNNL